jgi:serine/threonine protein kinase
MNSIMSEPTPQRDDEGVERSEAPRPSRRPAPAGCPATNGSEASGEREQGPDQQFWLLWRQGKRPDLDQFLSKRPELSPSQVASVVSIDQYERWRAGQRIPAEDYLRLLPAGADTDQAACDVIYGEYLLREQLGESPSLDEYRTRFPAQATLLARQVELHDALTAEEADGPSMISRPSTHHARARTKGVPETPPEIPGYEILEELGRGGMGIVYKARQVSLDRVVALKVLNVKPDRDPVALDRMRREARVMARMSHPHIVAVYDAGQAGDRFYFAMEYIAGADLHRLVEQGGPLPVDQSLEYMRQAALGLQHAHEHGLVHRDVKPSNLIVTAPVGAPGSVLKILDLGLARLVIEQPGFAPAAPSSPITQVGSFMGTPDFMAPEQANDPRSADSRSDLYSLGCTFYYVLSGRPPFGGGTPLAKLMQHHLEDAVPLEELCPSLPRQLGALVRKLMAKRPEDRFTSAAELAAALDELTRRQGDKPRSDGEASSGLRPFGRPRSPLTPRRNGGSDERQSAPVPIGCGLVQRLTGHSEWIKCVDFAPDGKLIASAGLDRTLRLWTIDPPREVWRKEGHTSAILCLDFAPDGLTLATGGQDLVLCLWDVAARRGPVWRSPGHSDNINAVAFSTRGDRILTASHDGTLRWWDAATGRTVRAWPAHDGPVWGVALTADGRQALSGGQDRLLRVWDVERGEALFALPVQAMPITCLALTADGRLALSGGMDGVVRLWDLFARREVRLFEGHTGRVTSVEFSPDGKRFASGSRDRSVRIRETSGGEVCSFTGHNHWVTAVAWNPAGTRVVSASVDRSLCVWEVTR